jgi:hypothetical protein
MICTKCSATILDGAKFCGSCGSPMTSSCRVCSEPNPLGIRFCQYCGSELSNALAGLPLKVALDWRDQFNKIGWSDDPAENLSFLDKSGELRKQALVSILKEHQLAEPDSKSEPYLFLSHVSPGRPWKISRIFVDGCDMIKSGFSPFFFIATRCRFILVDTKNYDIHQWLFKDVEEVTFNRNWHDTVGFRTKDGHEIGIFISIKGTRLIDKVISIGHVATGGGHEGEYVVAQINMARAAQGKADFMSVVADFFSDILKVS